jgi:hypothetical protein
MGMRLDAVVEDKYLYCYGCHRNFLVEDMTEDDWNFTWDCYVTEDSCSECYSKFEIRGND